MKRGWSRRMAAGTVLTIAVVLAPGWAAAQKTMSVQVKTTPIRETPSFVAKGLASLSYGDQVAVLETQGTWNKISAKGVTGWVHSSALTRGAIRVKTGQAAQVGASDDEVAAAGKGFNAQVEKEFKTRHRDIDFAWVDRMEKIKVSPEQVRAFLAAGKVSPLAGGAK